jgi:Recombination endonuclease VII
MRVPFVVYADFESFLKPISTCLPNPAQSYTKNIQKHSQSSFCYHIKCFDDSLFNQNPVSFTAENEDDDVAQIFVDTLEQNIRDIYQQFKFAKIMVFTKDNKVQYSSATTCHICEEELGEYRIRDHCHLTGKSRGAAHNGCNINYKIPKFVPVFATIFRDMTVTCLSKSLNVLRTMEKNSSAFLTMKKV